MKNGLSISLELDGQLVVDKFISEEPVFDHPGSIGLYTEDATVEISAVSYCKL